MDPHAKHLPPDQAVQLALRLGRRDAEIYAAVHGVTVEEARRKFRETRQRGRRTSRCLESDDDR